MTRGGAGQRRAGRHDAAVLGQRGADRAGGPARDGRDAAGRRRARPCRPRCARGSSWRWPRRSCCGAAGRSSSRGWQSIVNRSLNMFTLIALGVGVAYVVQRGRDARARRLSRRRSGWPTAAWPSTSRPPPSSSRWCCWARCSSCARAARPAPRSARCSAWRRRPPGGSRRRRARRTCRSSTSRPATGCACGPARRCRWTAWCSRARARWTSRW